MTEPDSLREPLRRCLALFTDGEPSEPRTASEIAAALSCSRRTAYNRLESLADRGFLSSKKVGARARVWWLDRDSLSATNDELGGQAPSLYSEMLDRMSDAFFALDTELRFTYLNERAESLVGRDQEALLGTVIWEAFPEAVGSTFQAEYERALETQSRVSFEEYYPPLSAWFEVTAYPSSSGLSVHFDDVTKRVRRERDRQRYQALVETIEDGIYTVDTDGVVTFCNEAYAAMFGQPRKEVIGSHVSELVDDKTISRASEVESELIGADRSTATLEAQLESTSGDRFVAEARFSLLNSVKGEQERVGVVRDVTDRVERQRQLERYQRVVETVRDGVYVLDEDQRFVMVNEAFLQMTGYSRGELLGSHASLVTDSENVEYVNDIAGDLQSTDDPVETVEIELQTADDERLPVQTRFTVLTFDEDSEADTGLDQTGTARVGVARDITDRRRRERELAAERAHLRALKDLNALVRDLMETVLSKSTRTEIEHLVCERLADSDAYQFAWVGEVDPAERTVVPRTGAETDGYTDAIRISTDPGDRTSAGPTGRAAITDRMQVVDDCLDAERYGPWRARALEYGFRSSAAIPLSAEGTTYGLLSVYSARPNAFRAEEGRAIEQLGEVVGHALADIERKRALTTDEVVELNLTVQGVLPGGERLPDGATVRYDSVVPAQDDRYLAYLSVDEAVLDTTLAFDGILGAVESTSVLNRTDGVADVEVRLTDPPLPAAIAAAGGNLVEATIEADALNVVVYLPHGADVREMVSTVEEAYPESSVVTNRQTTRVRNPASRLYRTFDELTDRQQTALETAYFAGFFEWPRTSDGTDVADALEVSPSTFHQHLRLAERRVMQALFHEGN